MRRLWQWFRAKRSKPLAAHRVPDDVLLTALEARITPQDLPQVEMQLRDSFGLHFRSGYPASSPVGAPLRATELQQLAKNPKLAAVFVFHGDGYLREAALQSLASRLSHSVVAYGLFLRLNDWSEPVRNAAWKALDRCLAATPPEILAPAIWTILQNGRSWGRWQQGYFGFVTRIMQPPALREHLITQLLAQQKSGSTTVFRALSFSPDFDPALPRIASTARQPHLRASALQAMATNRMIWPLGHMRKVWTDKSMGQYRLTPAYGTRPLSIQTDILAALERAVHDPSIAVQKQLLDSVSQHRDDPALHSLAIRCLHHFAPDHRPAIRKRLSFLSEHLAASSQNLP